MSQILPDKRAESLRTPNRSACSHIWREFPRQRIFERFRKPWNSLNTMKRNRSTLERSRRTGNVLEALENVCEALANGIDALPNDYGSLNCSKTTLNNQAITPPPWINWKWLQAIRRILWKLVGEHSKNTCTCCESTLQHCERHFRCSRTYLKASRSI